MKQMIMWTEKGHSFTLSHKVGEDTLCIVHQGINDLNSKCAISFVVEISNFKDGFSFILPVFMVTLLIIESAIFVKITKIVPQ